MEVKELKRLLAALADADVGEFKLQTEEYTVSLKRGQVTTVVQQQPGASGQAAAAEPATQPAQAATSAETGVAAALDPQTVDVTAPIVGTFYAAPAPDTADYVKVGDRVTRGAVLCIIEAMKLMNEIEAETDGVITEILVNNEDPVEYGQTLFRMRPT